MKLGVLGLGIFLALPAAQAASANTSRDPCVAPASLFSSANFRKYPAVSFWRGPSKAADVRSGQAHLYRTLLRQEGVAPPNFAGHYKVVTAGCGAGMVCPLFVDLKTGKVTAVPTLRSVEWDYSQADGVATTTGIDDSRLVYRRDSRLLVALGTRNENPKQAGASLYEWGDRGLRLIRFVPGDILCSDRKVS